MSLKQKVLSSSYTQLVQSFARENFNLKVLSGACLTLTFLALLLVAFFVKQGPVVIALDGSGRVAPIETKITDAQIEEAVSEYVQRRYTWQFGNITERLRDAENFVDPNLVASFRKAMLETIKFVKEKKVAQRMFPRTTETKVDLKEKTVTLVMDRITEFDSLKAATETRLTVWFDSGARTRSNPWGIYVVKEQEIGGSR